MTLPPTGWGDVAGTGPSDQLGAISVRALTTAIGATVQGVNLGSHLDDVTMAEIRQALLDHLVIFFEDQDITPAQQLVFSQRFGPVMLPLIDTESTEQPGVTVLDQVAPKGQFTDRWHTDHSFMAEPPLGTLLRAVQLPGVGGDTCFASMYAAYEDLSSSMQRFLEGLTAVHSTERVAASTNLDRVFRRDEGNHVEAPVHPVVRTHPETGRNLLYVCGNFTTRIVELQERESDAVLQYLFGHINSPEFHCRYHWQRGSVVLWDNRAAQHLAVPDYSERRVMHRSMIAGDRPFGPVSRAPADEHP
jgi:taurine dioxygenase